MLPGIQQADMELDFRIFWFNFTEQQSQPISSRAQSLEKPIHDENK